MHAIPNPQYLRLGYHFAQVTGGGPHHQDDVQAAERTEDGAVRFKDARGPKTSLSADRSFTSGPTFFSNRRVPASAQQFGIVTDTPYKVIGSTHTHTHYTSPRRVLKRRPLPRRDASAPASQGRRRPVLLQAARAVDTARDGRICKAVAVWNAGNYFGHRFSMEFTLDVAAETGLIYRWSTAGVAHTGPFQTRYRVDASYADVTAESTAPAGFFDR